MSETDSPPDVARAVAREGLAAFSDPDLAREQRDSEPEEPTIDAQRPDELAALIPRWGRWVN
jgi:hypothetical protein